MGEQVCEGVIWLSVVGYRLSVAEVGVTRVMKVYEV